MKRTLTALFFLFILLVSAGCSPTAENPTDTSGDFYTPASFVTLSDVGISLPASSVSVVLTNGSDLDLSLGGTFTAVAGNTSLVYTGTVGAYRISAGSSATLNLKLTGMNLSAGTYTVTLPYTWIDADGKEKTDYATCTLTVVETPDVPFLPPEDRDVTVTPIAELTESEGKKLAEYLFERYIPNCFGVFDSPAELTSSSVWASVYALNLALEGESEEHLTREDSLKKAARYYPGANFVPEDVRLFNKATGKFMAVPVQEQNYKFLSYEIHGDSVTVFYEEIPEDVDQTPGQYATTLKNSEETGFFTFVSTKRVGALG